MSYDGHTPITTEQRLPEPLNGSLYVTTRLISAEKSTPEIGTTMEAEIGPAWADSRIVSVQVGRQSNRDVLNITHARIPTFDEQLISNWQHSTADLGGVRFNTVTRTFVMLASSYDPVSPLSGSGMPESAPFAHANFLMLNKSVFPGGSILEPTFRSETRTYIQRVTTSEVTLDLQTGNSKRAVTTLYYKGETVPGHDAIETLAANPALAFWGLQPTGVFRELQQLSDNWFAITESTMFGSLAAYSSGNPAKQRVFERVTPVSDLIFYEVGLMPDPIPAIGTAHYSLADFQLLFIEPADKTGLLYTFYYAKARSDESSYNYVLNEGGLTLTRTRVALRASVPGAPAVGTADPTFGNYKYATREIKRFGELRYDMRFVIVEDLYSLQDQDIQLSVDRRPGYRVIGKSKFLPAALNPSSPGDAKSSSFSERGWQTSEETAEVISESVGTGFERKPFVKITTNTNASATPELPVQGSGTSKLVWLNETQKVFQNEVTVSEAVEGPAGQDKEIRPFVQIDTDKRYSQSNTINTTQGNARVVYNDGMTLVYEIGEVSSTGRYGPAGQEQQRKAFVTTLTDKSYSASPTLPGGQNGSSRKIYDDGTVVVYEHALDTNTANPGPAGVEKDARVGYMLTTNKEYSTTSDVTANTGNSRVVFNDGSITIYEIGNITASPAPVSFIGGKTAAPLFEETTNTEYKTSPEGTGIYQSRVSFTDGDLTVYEVNSTVVSPGETRVYNTLINDRVPSVLKALVVSFGKRKDGGVKPLVDVQIEEGYQGTFLGRVTEYYTQNPSVAAGFQPMQFRPKAIVYQGYNLNFSIPPTLHVAQQIFESTGTNDPDYEYATNILNIAPTTPTDIPSGFVPYALDVQPFKDGYIVREIEIKYK